MSRGSGGRQAGMRRDIGFVAAVLYLALLGGCSQSTTSEQSERFAQDTKTVTTGLRDAGLEVTAIGVIESDGGFWETRTGLSVGKVRLFVFGRASPPDAAIQEKALAATSQPAEPSP